MRPECPTVFYALGPTCRTEQPWRVLHECATASGFVAAREARANYRRIWARDGVICGLASLAAHRCPGLTDPVAGPSLLSTFEATLRTLAHHVGPCGQVPSNVQLEGDTRKVSYGGRAGRVDATLWFMIGCCAFGRLAGRDDLVEELWPVLLGAAAVTRAWEFNEGGLIYVPQGGDWADELPHHGYLLYDQVLRIWALRELARAADQLGRDGQGFVAQACRITEEVERRYWRPVEPGGTASYFLLGFNPTETYLRFDGFGNALCCLLEIGPTAWRDRCVDYASSQRVAELVPALHPPIEREEAAYLLLQQACAFRFRNHPGRYHNGGLWPVINAFWSIAARRAGRTRLASSIAAGVERANASLGRECPEYLDARTSKPGGALGQAWSAAASLLVRATAYGFGNALVPDGAGGSINGPTKPSTRG